jgi:predicted phage tail component-like protein
MANGFSFNGVHSNTFNGVDVVINYGKDILPEMENRLLSIPGRDGVIDLGYTFKERVIPVSFLLRGADIADYYSKAEGVAKWLNTGVVKPFMLDVLPGRTFQARPMNRIDPERFVVAGIVTVEFLIPDVVSEGIIKDFTPVQGTTYVYGGNYKTFPVFTITVKAALTSLKLTKGGTSEFILVNRAFAINDIITIDMKKRKIMLNGVTDLRPVLDVTSTWFTISENYSFTLNNSASTIKVVFPERWL